MFGGKQRPSLADSSLFTGYSKELGHLLGKNP